MSLSHAFSYGKQAIELFGIFEFENGCRKNGFVCIVCIVELNVLSWFAYFSSYVWLSCD